jgi:hypothetical protein
MPLSCAVWVTFWRLASLKTIPILKDVPLRFVCHPVLSKEPTLVSGVASKEPPPIGPTISLHSVISCPRAVQVILKSYVIEHLSCRRKVRS